MSRAAKERQKRVATPQVFPNSVCYCDGDRELGTLELFCSGCLKWFHGRCLRQLKEFYGLSFMICYVFHCEDCSPTGSETWTPKQANFIHMLVTVLANLTCEKLKKNGDVTEQASHTFFSLEKDIIPYFNKNWDNLTSMPRRVKTTWHNTLQKALSKETDLFTVNAHDENEFALNELNLAKIGPMHEAVKQIGKKTSSANNLTSTLLTAQANEKAEEIEAGPKTRGASKRRTAEGSSQPGKKGKYAADSVQTRVAGMANPVEVPFNKEGYRYYLVEKDTSVPDLHTFEHHDVDIPGRVIPAFIYRISHPQTVTISPNDRAYQLKVSDDLLTVTGWEGYCLARSTHSVAKGTWYFEVNFLKQPEGSHIRIGWGQQLAVIQACLGYTKFSYSWRSLKGTKFHDACGKKYQSGGYQEGDVLGCLIHLPIDPATYAGPSSDYLPPAHKDLPMINFKHNYFYEGRDEVNEEMKKLAPMKGSRIEFFLNGKSCGTAFADVYSGFYHPAISIFQGATVQCNFGPKFRFPAKGARAMSERAQEVQHEQALSDMMYLVEHADERVKQAAEIKRLIAQQGL